MKFSTVVLLLLPLLASALDVTTTITTEDAVVVNGTSAAVDITPPSTKAPPVTPQAKEQQNGQQQAPVAKLDRSSLHRVPLYEDRHLAVETISKLDSLINGGDASPSPKSTTDAPKVELPIPSRCPAITGTEAVDNQMPPLIGAVDNTARAAQRGCRFFIMTELMDRSSAEYLHASAAEQINRTLEECFTSCINAYDNGTTAGNSCQDGCRKTALVTEAAKKSASPSEDTEDSVSSSDNEGGHRSFSIIVPLITRDQDSETNGEDGSSFQSNMPRALQTMMAMMHSLAERARQSMAAQREASGGLSNEMDPRGGAISVSRSMSVVMTRDKDGHQKVVVVHQLPRISIHRETFGGMDQDGSDDAVRRFEEMLTGGEDSSDDLRSRYFGHLANGGGHRTLGSSSTFLKNDLQSLEDEGIDGAPTMTSSESTQAYYYRSRLCYLLPRLFYVTLIILSLYMIFWLCCVASTTIATRSARLARGGAGTGGESGSVAIMTDGKLKKLFLSKNARYYKLNNKTGRSNSTTSLPPPYPGQQDSAESCAESLPEKAPLPEGGLEVSGLKK